MTRGARIAIATLSVLLAGSIALLVWLYVNDKAAAAEWALKDAERVLERNTSLSEAASEHLAALAAMSDRHEEEKARIIAGLQPLIETRKKRRKPASLVECEVQLAESAQEIGLRIRASALDKLTIANLDVALKHSMRRGDILEAVVYDEINRADGWREVARKGKRRERIKIAFTAIGSAAVGGLAGYGIGAATQ